MGKKYFIVTFINGKTVFVASLNKESAEILASSVMTNNGLTVDIKDTVITINSSDLANADFVV